MPLVDVVCDAYELVDQLPLADVIWDEEGFHEFDLHGCYSCGEEVAALPVFDEMLDKNVENEKLSDCNTNRLLQQLAGCKDYMVDKKMKPIVQPYIDDKLRQVSVPMVLHMDAVSDMFSEIRPEMVIWDDEMPPDQVLHDGLLQLVAGVTVYMDGFAKCNGDEVFEKMPPVDVMWDEEYYAEKTMTGAELTDKNMFNVVGSNLELHDLLQDQNGLFC